MSVSGKKISLIISASILLLMLLVPVLSTNSICGKRISAPTGILEEETENYDTVFNDHTVSLSIGRDILISL
jgi:hypothetical protein